MRPVICFFEGDLYIYSTDYELALCPDEIAVTAFLESIDSNNLNKMKIVQINFDAFQASTKQVDIFKTSKAAVFILNNYQLLTLQNISISHNLIKNTFLKDALFKLQITKNNFLENIISIKKMISAGRLYQVNLTTTFMADLKTDPLDLFLSNYLDYSGNYKCFLPFANHSLVSFSPELFLEKNESILKTEPIKGSISKNQNYENDLIKNEKEESELSMIVDLLRNDLNGLELENSAQVIKHRELMNLNYIQHTFSEIQIQTSKLLPYILEKMMPGGSISGCPKKESLLVIQELEPHKRGAYTGTIGWWKDDNFKLNIAIRTFLQTESNYYYFAGCGIVYDSDPETEFAELLNKTGNLNVKYI
ncbi:MAG: chorismate-binding protein [Pseudobdellovibrio sp.]